MRNVYKCPKCGFVFNGNDPTQRSKQKNNTSGIKGVYLMGNLKWGAQVNYNGRRYYLGSFDTVREAAKAREQKITSLKEG